MTYSLSNNCTKNYYNRTLTVQVIVEDVVTWIFLKHSVVVRLMNFKIYFYMPCHFFVEMQNSAVDTVLTCVETISL